MDFFLACWGWGGGGVVRCPYWTEPNRTYSQRVQVLSGQDSLTVVQLSYRLAPPSGESGARDSGGIRLPVDPREQVEPRYGVAAIIHDNRQCAIGRDRIHKSCLVT